jgi:acyl-CoA oxidase
VRVPKNNLFTKYVEVSDEGEYKRRGDARVGYGTMMFSRETISNALPKIYAQAIIIATRYSFFRKQGLGHDKQEISILEYQTQQEKILPRMAEYYAITLAGAMIR